MIDSDKKKDDPAADPDFMRVVDHFLKTPHKPHKPTKDSGKSPAPRERAKKKTSANATR